SGSTGRPKGVMVEHGNLANLLQAMRGLTGIAAGDGLLAVTTLGFDIAGLELYLPLVVGARTIVLDRESARDATLLARALDDSGATLMQATPSTWRMLVEGGWPGSAGLTALCGGEALPAQLAAQLRARVGTLWNVYGPTETTIWSSAQRVEGAVNIGRPIDNTQFYLLDAHGEPVPMGVAGEIYIGGAGVARGYLNREDLTAERFLADPFRAGGRMYRTGDLGRWLPEGEIEYLGRNDHQVKLRGFRIELGEIEARLAQVEGVREAVVLARTDTPGEARLVAYVTGAEPVEVPVLREALLAHLPEYMVPAAYVWMEQLPLTPNGKLDRRALPMPDSGALSSQLYEAPVGPFETTLAGIWSELLGVERVGRDDDFFALGGHSLQAVRMVLRVRQQLDAELALAKLFAQPRLRDIARVIERGEQTLLPVIESVERTGLAPLSFAQQRLWFLERIEGAGAAYHIPVGVRLRGALDEAALRSALDAVVARHEALRTTFVEQDGEAAQRIAAADCGLVLTVSDVSASADREAQAQRLALEEASAAFDLSTGPLIRGRLLRVAQDDHVLLVTMHHIVSDGWSMGVLIREFAALYDAARRGLAAPLPALPVQYVDYAVWQRRWLEGEVLQQQGAYWRETLAGAPGLLSLPTDRPRPERQDYSGASIEVVVDAALTARLAQAGRRYGATVFMMVLAGWSAVLGRLAGQDEVVIGAPVANRTRPEVEGLIGFFANTLALRVDLGGAPTVAELVERVRERVQQAQVNQDLPFEQVVELARPVRSLAHSPV
ncbi:amino acid adenylation domain-containing protein, partial [Pseudomonas entomophila]|uniref:amino acid adenylation domain-containing protein n=1 Tax=Pseudomonas entomophila TaxID=312306 RepID=UPI0023D80E3B